MTVCVESEFANRADGLPGMQKAYGMSIPAKETSPRWTPWIIYTQVKKGSCTLRRGLHHRRPHQVDEPRG
ncbi:hypothetical protein ACRAWF_10355 [Streptomyces sp. L7]